MTTTPTGLRTTQRTVAALACLMLGLGALLVGLATSATASDHGANPQSGPYDPANVGEGDNQGKGKAPANGTVGKADGKNPPGQYPNGSDRNKGYECDDNKGVGNDGGNPAHSGCAPPTTPPGGQRAETCPDGSPLPSTGVDDCDEVRGIQSNPPDGGPGGGGAAVLGIEANAPAAGDAPAAVPTAVDAGNDESGPAGSLWLLVGTALALTGAAIGLNPAARGKRSW